MDVQFGPNSVEEPSLQYKLQSKIKVFNTSNTLPNRGYNLVASSSKYGLVFVGCPDGTLSVYYMQQLVDKNCETPQLMSVQLTVKPTHIAISCDQELLVVTGDGSLIVFNITKFQNQNPAPIVSLDLGIHPSTYVSSLQWNPCAPDTIAIAYFDGTLLVAQVNTKQIKKVQAQARCICWSPKGKQLVIGNSDGTLCQYKPDLSPMKTVPAPNLFDGAPVEAVAIHWISTYQFAVVYRNTSDNSRPALTIVNTPKAGQPSCLNYEDICYSMGSNRPWYYYLQGLVPWNIILAASSNSMELATLSSADGSNWKQWCQTDEARPELPLTDKKIENFPVGVCIDTCFYLQLPWGENETLPHMPVLYVVSQSGLLILFNVINLNKQAAQIPVTQPQQLSLPASALTSVVPGDVQIKAAPAAPAQSAPKVTSFGLPAQSVFQSSAPPPPSQSVVPQAAPASALTAALSAPAQSTAASGAPTLTTSAFGGAGSGPVQISTAFSANKPPPSYGQMFGSLAAEQRQQADPRPAVPTHSQPPPTTHAIKKPTPTQAKPQAAVDSPSTQMSAQAKEEQERANIMKASQELRKMLIKEVNDFQTELYKFKLSTSVNQIDLTSLSELKETTESLRAMDTEQLRKECSLEDIRATIIELKLELVRTCAIVAETRTHSDMKYEEWTQVDPLSVKRLASVKKLAYYVQNQLEQAHKALDYMWSEIIDKNQQFYKPGQRMIRPILDEVYQPLVKQQEILSRQQAVLRALRNTLKECDVPTFKSAGIFRTTPFKNKDPLSKLTKNILNMSIEPQDNKTDNALASQKLDALRDMLANHKTVKIKPVNMELSQHLATMRLNYEKSVKEKAAPATNVTEMVKKEHSAFQSQPELKFSAQMNFSSKPVIKQEAIIKSEYKESYLPQISPQVEAKLEPMPKVPLSFSPTSSTKSAPVGFGNVARTLFTDEPNKDQTPQPQAQKMTASVTIVPKSSSTPVSNPTLQKPTPTFSFAKSTSPPASDITRSALKDLLQNKSQLTQAQKIDSFMGQKICSPSSFSTSTPLPASPQASDVTSSKPVSEIATMMSKYQPKEPTELATSSETGEPEKPRPAVMFGTNREKPLSSVGNALDSKSSPVTPQNTLSGFKIDGITKLETRPAEKDTEKSKEKLENTTAKVNAEKKENSVPKSFFGLPVTQPTKAPKTDIASIQPINVAAATSSDASDSPTEVKLVSTKEEKLEAKPTETKTSSASSLFSAANAKSGEKPSFSFAPSSSSPQTSAFADSSQSETPSINKPSLFSSTVTSTPLSSTPSSVTPTAMASNLFATAQSTVTSVTPQSPVASPQSIFSTATTTTQSVFGTSPTTTKSSVFGSPTSSVFASTTQAASPTATPASVSSPSLFSTSPTSQASSIFASALAKPSSMFAAANAASPTSIFGSATSTPASIFGSAVATTTQASIFGSPDVTTTPSSVFATPTTTKASVFGTPAAATTPSSVFGTSTDATTPSSVFATPTTTTQTSIFATPTATTQSSVFGTPSATTQSSVFGTPSATTQASVFGTPTAATAQTSVFGAPNSTTAQSGSSLFGTTDNLFGSATISTTSAPSQPSGSIFGSSPGFGGSSPSNVFGGKSTFGGSAQTSSIFGSSTEQKPANNLWGAGATKSSPFGASAFGGQQATTEASSVFGTGSFSTPSSGQSFGSASGQPAGFGSSSSASSVFGAAVQQQPSPGFGGSPGFGTKAAFGQPAGFGSSSGFGQPAFGGFNKNASSGFGAPAAFGGGATFGGGASFGSTSPSKVFGGAAPAPSFGSPTQSNAMFESLATQNTMSFGNLAQQTPQPSAQPTFNTSQSFTGWRG